MKEKNRYRTFSPEQKLAGPAVSAWRRSTRRPRSSGPKFVAEEVVQRAAGAVAHRSEGVVALGGGGNDGSHGFISHPCNVNADRVRERSSGTTRASWVPSLNSISGPRRTRARSVRSVAARSKVA